jgi:tungstate transport system substrate-binding protein
VGAVALLCACGGGDSGGAPRGGSRELLLASTTSTEDSGLLDVLIPAFEAETGYNVKLISGGSGQAITLARRGDIDVLLVHSPDAEREMVAAGQGIERALVMHNDFVLVGPPDDPAGAGEALSLGAAMRAIARAGAAFVSRGDDSGTHVAELRLWADVGVDPSGEDWYAESGQGQGATLRIADQRRAYALTDRGTFVTQRGDLELRIISGRLDELSNHYHVIVVNPGRHPDVNVEGARAWAAWVTGAEAQALIASFGVEEHGEPIFYADAGKPDPTE